MQNTNRCQTCELVARRHMAAIDEMSDDEAVELGRLLRRVSYGEKPLLSQGRSVKDV